MTVATAEQVLSVGRKLTIIEETGNLFEAPGGSILIHACNCQGFWGAGIAESFIIRFPRAFQMYKAHCNDHQADLLLGTALVIPPCEDPKWGCNHYIGCLFTSEGIGRTRSSPGEILAATQSSMLDMMETIETHSITGIYMCKINAGLFNVPWKKTKAVLEALELDYEPTNHEIRVWSMEPV
jgi:ADP-ribose 1''-phosphate phosphatase